MPIIAEKQRQGVVVKPHSRLSESAVELIDEVSRDLLLEPGLLCWNAEAARIFERSGAAVEDAGDCLRIRIPPVIIDWAVDAAPSEVVLGARDPENRLILDADEPRVRFGSGSEANIWLDVRFEDRTPTFVRREGSIERLCAAAHLAENLEHLDFFLRCVNIRDKEINRENKDVNKFLASLNNTTKHVQAGLTDVDALDHVIRMSEIIAGGPDAFRANPPISFITCVIKSPLQMVDDTATTLIEISKRRVPVVISSCPMAGTTAPFDEFGLVAQINAEVLAGVALNQLAAPGAPVLYGAVASRSRLDNLNDMYGAPEFNHYLLDAAQMARHYGLPCYSSAGVGDTSVPGIQATAEKMLTLCGVPLGGPQYVHYAFGLLERTNVFCPEQAILDDAHIGMIKRALKEPDITRQDHDRVVSVVREVMASDHRTFIYHLPLPTREPTYVCYPLEDDGGGALRAAHEQYRAIMDRPRCSLPEEMLREITASIPGILPDAIGSTRHGGR